MNSLIFFWLIFFGLFRYKIKMSCKTKLAIRVYQFLCFVQFISCTHFETIYVSTMLILYSKQIFLTGVTFQWKTSSWVTADLLRTLIPTDAVIWMVSILPRISIFPRLFSKPLGVVPSAPTKIGITVILMFHSFFNSPARSKYLSIIWPNFNRLHDSQ